MHKTTYAPMIYTALCIMFWMRVYPLLREVGGGWALEFSSFWALNGTLLSARCHFTDPKKSFRAQIAFVIDAARINNITYGVVRINHRYVNPYEEYICNFTRQALSKD